MQRTDTTSTSSFASSHPSASVTTPVSSAGHRPATADVRRWLGRRSVAVLATTSPAGRPHAATVLYQMLGDSMLVSTLRDSRKARNIAGSSAVAVTVPVRRVPFGPPSSIQFQTVATLLDPHDEVVAGHVAAGELRRITSHGELDLPGGCLLRIEIPDRVHTYGLGMSLVSLLRRPLEAAGEARLR